MSESVRADVTEEDGRDRTDEERRELLEAVANLDCQSGENAARMLQSFEEDDG